MTAPVLAPDAAVAADIFLHVKAKKAGVAKGEAIAKGHAGEIAVDGFAFGVAASTAAGSGQSTARRQYDTLVVRKRLDSATTPLLSALTSNDALEAKLALRKPGDGQDDHFTIALKGARVVRVDIDCDENGDAVERIELNFMQIEIAYRVQTADGLAGATSVFADDWSTSGV